MTIQLKRSKYRLMGLIGQGQFGRVYFAIHRRNGRIVALKSLDPDRFPTHQFLRELRFLLTLQHPNIVTCHAIEHVREGRYLVMDYCEGGTLRHLMEQDHGLTLAQVFQILTDTLSGLAHAHSRGIVHCDVKPENILLNLQADGWTARISDFGIARLIQELTSGSGATGSPAYMAPERFYGQYSISSDLYAIGILIYELLMGERPFSGTPGDLMSAHLNQPIKIPAMIPEPLRPLIERALQKLTARRFHSAAEMLTALQNAQTQMQSQQDLTQIRLPLNPPELTWHRCLCQSQSHQNLLRPIQVMLPALGNPNHLYQLSACPGGAEVTLCDINANGHRHQQWIVPEPLHDLLSHPQGCLALADRAIYHLADYPLQVLQLTQKFLAGLTPQAEWLATLVPVESPEKTASELSIWQLLQQRWALVRSPVPCQTVAPSQILIMDRRYLAIVSTDGRNFPGSRLLSVPSHAGTCFELMNRRGICLGRWTLPVVLQHFMPGIRDYQFMAIAPYEPNTVFLISFKPLRMTRLKLEITPVAMTRFSWGYGIVGELGHIVLLNEYGAQIGQIDPSEEMADWGKPTAISAWQNTGLRLALWNDRTQTGRACQIELQQLALDIVF